MTFSIESLKQWCFSPERDRRNELRILAWIFGWMLTFLATKQAVSREWFTADWQVVTAVAVVAVFGAGALLAYRRFLRETDELRRKIELDALALGFGVGLLGGFVGSLLADAGLFVSDEPLSDLFVLMCITYGIGVLVGTRRYS